MTNFYKLFKSLICICLGILFSQCSNDDLDHTIPIFPESQMSLIHGGSEKSWRLTEIINGYADPSDDLYITVECVRDDIYTFSSENEEISVTYGDNFCFEDIEEGIFRADHEYFGGKLMMLGTPKTIYVSFGRGYTNDEGTAMASTFAYYALAELSENRMVFYKSHTGVIGDYYEAYTFEAVESPE